MTDPRPHPAVSLAATRVRIRAHLLSTASPSATAEKSAAPSNTPLWMHLLAGVMAMAEKGNPAQSLRAWWTSVTASQTLAAAFSTAVSTLVPIAKRHPVRLVLCAAAAGAAIVWIRPWRWVTAAAAATSLAVAVDLLTQAPPKDNAWSAFMDFVARPKGPPQP